MTIGKVLLFQISIKKLYFLTAFILILLTTFVGAKKYTPPMETGLKLIAREIQTDFPKDLNIAITPEGIKGKADYPVILKTPASLRHYLTPNLIVVDPNGQEFMLETYQSLILVTDSRIVTLSSQGYQEVDMASIPTIELNQSTIDKLTDNLSQFGQKAKLYVTGFFLARGLANALVIWPIYLILLTIIYNITDRNLQQRTESHLQEVTFAFLPLISLHTVLQIINIRISLMPWFVIAHMLLVLYLKGKRLSREDPPYSEKARS